MKTWHRTLLSASVLSLLGAGEARADAAKPAAPPASAEEASQRFKAGVGFYKDGDFTAALVEFKRAYELSPNYNVLYNIGQTARELKDYAAALSAFERYLRDGGKKIDGKRKKDVEAAVEELHRKVGRLKVVTNVEGAEIVVDDVLVGKAPLPEALVVNVGRRKLAATSSGYVPVQRVVDVASMAEATVTLELAKVEPTLPATPAEPAPVGEPSRRRDLRVAAWVTASAGAAATIAAAVTGGLAVAARGNLSQALATYPGDPAAIADAQSRTRGLAIATDVTLGLGLAAAATSAVLFVVGRPSAEPEKQEKAEPKASLVVGPTGVFVAGRF